MVPFIFITAFIVRSRPALRNGQDMAAVVFFTQYLVASGRICYTIKVNNSNAKKSIKTLLSNLEAIVSDHTKVLDINKESLSIS